MGQVTHKQSNEISQLIHNANYCPNQHWISQRYSCSRTATLDVRQNSYLIYIVNIISYMQEEIKSVAQFFKTLIISHRQTDPVRFVALIKSLVYNKFQFASEKWRSFETLESYKGQSQNRTFFQMLDALRLWAMTRSLDSKSRVEGFKYYLRLLALGLQYLDQMKETQQWFIECIKRIVILSKRAFIQAKSACANTQESSEKLLQNFFQQLRHYKSSRTMEFQTKKEFSLIIQTLQVSIYFQTHNYTKCERGLELLKRDILMYKPESLNIFYFQYGRLCLVNHKFKEAEENFERIRICTQSQAKLILRYLIPCKIFLGKMCTSEEFPEYYQLIQGIKRGNFSMFDEAMEKYQKLWIKRGIFLLMQKMRILVWRSLLRRIQTVLESDKIQMGNIVKALRLMGGRETQNECLCIIGSMIYQGYVKGYIFCGESKVLVLKKEGAFVPLAKVAQ